MKIKFITTIYSNLYGTEYGGRPSRKEHYRYSLLSLMRMNADFVCYTNNQELNELNFKRRKGDEKIGSCWITVNFGFRVAAEIINP